MRFLTLALSCGLLLLGACAQRSAWTVPVQAVDTAALAKVAPAGRLPGTARPHAYRVNLDLDPRETHFSGSVEIDVTLQAGANGIWLHGDDLDVSRVTATAGGETVEASWALWAPAAGASTVLELPGSANIDPAGGTVGKGTPAEPLGDLGAGVHLELVLRASPHLALEKVLDKVVVGGGGWGGGGDRREAARLRVGFDARVDDLKLLILILVVVVVRAGVLERRAFLLLEPIALRRELLRGSGDAFRRGSLLGVGRRRVGSLIQRDGLRCGCRRGVFSGVREAGRSLGGSDVGTPPTALATLRGISRAPC